jgi:glutamine synthetase
MAFAVIIASGLDGIRNETDPGEPVDKNIFAMSHREKRRLRIDEMPSDLKEALKAMKRDPLIREALGDHIFEHFTEAKQAAWHDYETSVHSWELDRYLARY